MKMGSALLSQAFLGSQREKSLANQQVSKAGAQQANPLKLHTFFNGCTARIAVR